eukprot:jgi/Psemu1/294176/fgenesh1_pm.10_\
MLPSPSNSFISGVSAALFGPFLMVLGFMIWDDDWTKKNGSAFSLNMFKCNLAALGFLIVICVTTIIESEEQLTSMPRGGTMFTESIETLGMKISPFQNANVKFLYASSIVGLLIGDWTWLEGLKYLGARKVIIMDSLKPFLAAFTGWVFFGENFGNPLMASVGLVLTVVGVALVGFEVEHEKEHECLDEGGTMMGIESYQNNDEPQTMINEMDGGGREDSQALNYGIFMSISNVVLHTLGACLTKKFGVEMTTWEINFVRFGFSGVCMLSVSERALVNYAMFQIPFALLLTLESIGPLYTLPLTLVMHKQCPSFRALVGAVFAVMGIILLSLSGRTN